MRICAVVHMYPPAHNAGAEWMLHSLLREMTRRGHRCIVLVPDTPVSELDGVEVRRVDLAATSSEAAAVFNRSDVGITHLDYTRLAARWSYVYRVPLAHLVHNEHQLSANGVTTPDLVVYNSRWLAKRVGLRGIVCRPPVDCAEYDTSEELDRRARGEGAVTLINLSANKGSHLFAQLAKAEPDRWFLGVAGAYDQQEPPRLANVDLEPQTPTIRDVYRRTRVLLVPSAYESYGRVAIEACCSGIPVVAHPTPGLLEALGDAGIFVNRNDVAAWRRVLACLDDEEAYRCHAAACLRRARVVAPKPVYDRFERAMLRLAAARL